MIPPVAPHQSCVSCFKGDTTTAFTLKGEAEWIMAALHKLRAVLARGQAVALDVAAMARDAGVSRDTAHRLLREAGSLSVGARSTARPTTDEDLIG